MNKKENRLRRARKARGLIRKQSKAYISIHRTPRHIYAQLIEFADKITPKVIGGVSTVQKSIKEKVKNTGNVEAAKEVGKQLAELAKKKGISTVAFDRGGYKYHGRVKALADAARENGLQF